MVRRFAALLFSAGLAFLLTALFMQVDFGQPQMLVGQGIIAQAPDATGAANIVTSVVLAYRGIDTLGEIAILFTAASAAGLLLGRGQGGRRSQADGAAGAVLRAGVDLLMPLLLVVGLFIIAHGHLTPGGGFQGGVILAAAFFLPALARPAARLDEAALALIEGLAGALFIAIGLIAMFAGKAFMMPLLGTGEPGELLSAGSLPLLYALLGLKVGAELAGLLTHLAEARD